MSRLSTTQDKGVRGRLCLVKNKTKLNKTKTKTKNKQKQKQKQKQNKTKQKITSEGKDASS